MTLRLRLTLGYVLVLLLTLLLGGSVVYYATAQTLRHNLDDSLREAAMLAQGSVEPSQNGELQFAPELRPTPGVIVQLLDTQGRQIGKVGTGEGVNLIPVKSGFQTVGSQQEHQTQVRVLTQLIGSAGLQNAVLRVSRSMEYINEFLETLVQTLFLVGVIMLALAYAAGDWLADRALRPLDDIVDTAQDIAQRGDYTRRVREPAPNQSENQPRQDELARLSTTINLMLDRLSDTIEHEKQFARMASHELRTPLTVLRGRLELTLERERTAPEYRKALEGMRGRVETLNTMTESLLALARTDSEIQLEPVELAAAALKAHENLEEQASRQGKQIQLEVSESWVWAESEGVIRAISNLLDNALKYGTGPQVGLRVSVGVVSVTSGGAGPVSEQWKVLLKPFERGQNTEGAVGSGLGLALVVSLCQRWQASVIPHWDTDKFRVELHFIPAPDMT